MINLNLDGVEAWKGGTVLPAGWHDVQINEHTDGFSSNNNPEIRLKMAAFVGEHAGGTISDWIQVTESTAGKVRQLLEAAQVQIPQGNFQLPEGYLNGRRVRLLIREEPDYQDPTKLRSRVKAYEPIGAPTPAPMPIGGAPAQQAQPQAPAYGQPLPGMPPQPAGVAGTSHAVDDDIPFAFEPVPAWPDLKTRPWNEVVR